MDRYPVNLAKSFLVSTFLIGLVGCSQTPKKTEEKTPKQPQLVEKIEEPKPSVIYKSDMSAEVMYKILLAEVLVKRGQPQPAYQLMHEAAEQSQDAGVAERSFQMSMGTFDVEAIKQSTDLWRELAPEEAVPWKASYLMAVREGRLEEAEAFWLNYVEKSDLLLDQLLIEASVRVTQSAAKQNGLKFMKRLMDRYPEQPTAYYAFAMSAEAYQEPFLAEIPLEKSIELYRKQEDSREDSQFSSEKMLREAHLLLASVYLKAQQAKKGLKKLKPYLEAHEEDWEFQEKYARLEVKAQLYGEAEQRYQLILENEPEALTSRLALALLQLEKRDYKASESNFKMLLKDSRYNSMATYYLGVANYESGQRQLAKEYYNQIHTDDYYIDAQLRIAEIDYPQKGLAETIAFIDGLEAKNDEHRVKLYRAKALFYAKDSQYQKSVSEYDFALTLAKDNVDLLLAQSVVLYELKSFDRYRQNLQIALKHEPNNPDVLNALGYFYVERKENLDDAERMLDKALQLAPDRFYILDSRGWLAYQRGHYQEAESYLEKALDRQLDDEVLIHLIQTKWHLDKRQDAIDLWEAYHQRFPENERLQNLLKELAN